MCDLFHAPGVVNYVVWDRKTFNTVEESMEALRTSKTIYVGNLSIFTTELQIEEIFSTVGPVKRIIMGLNSKTKEPCGFCFVEYFVQEHAYACLKYLHETRCDGRIIRCDLDAGFFPGRQYGRGKSGGQVQDDKRAQMGMKHDPGRGGVIQYDVGGGKRKRHENDRSIADLLSGGLSSGRASKESSDILRTLDGGLPTPRFPQASGGSSSGGGSGHANQEQQQRPRQQGTAYVAVGSVMQAPTSRIVHLASFRDEDGGGGSWAPSAPVAAAGGAAAGGGGAAAAADAADADVGTAAAAGGEGEREDEDEEQPAKRRGVEKDDDE